MARVLVVDDDRTIRRSLTQRLEEAGYQAEPADGARSARQFLLAGGFDAALVDIHLKDGDGLELLEEIRRDTPHVQVIMVTAHGDSARTIRAMKAGAFEYVTKPFELDVLLGVLARAVQTKGAVAPPAEGVSSDRLVGVSSAMLAVWKAIGRAATTRAPVLITGESGTGKELVARAIHEHMHGAKPFVAVNIAALPPTLVEAELFGHERGAFTGAIARREGRFEAAGDGTLFLDEIADLELPLQSKLLRVLEDGGYQRVGASTELKAHARIISATSRPVGPGSGGALREDLYYRLAVLRIDVPPLRERRQDIPLLVHSILQGLGPPVRAVSEAAMERLVNFDWPGNVRQLKHVLENACVMTRGDVLDSGAFDLGERRRAAPPSAPATPAPTGMSLAIESLDLRENIDRLTKKLIEVALEQAGGNRARASRLLGIRRALLYERMEQFGLRGGGDDGAEGER